MKKLAFLLILGIISAAFAFSQAQGKTMYVAVKSADIKSSTGIFASKVGVLNLGDAVTVLRTNGNWAEVRTSKPISGWVNLSGLSSKRIISAGGSSSAGEISLAGKGFSPDTEFEYRKNGLDYAVVNQMEAISISDDDLLKFVEAGRLVKGK